MCRMPVIDRSLWYALYYIVFVVLNVFIFLNILLASIYTNYKKHLKVIDRHEAAVLRFKFLVVYYNVT